MKNFECKYCNKIWFVKLDCADDVIGCPFCLKELPKPRVIIVDSFENAVLKIIVDYGYAIVNDRKTFLAYLTDIAFEYRKEIKILSNACDSKTFVNFYELTQCSLEDAKIKLQQIEKRLVDEEGIAEIWAKRICNCFINALREDFATSSQPKSNIGEITRKSKKEKFPNVTTITQGSPQVPKNNDPSNEQRLLSSGFSRLSSCMWEKATETFDEVLRAVDSPRAYVGKMMAGLHIRKESEIPTSNCDIESDPNWVRAINLATGSYKDKLKRYEQEHKTHMNKVKASSKPIRTTKPMQKSPLPTKQIFLPILKPERVQTIHQDDIEKKVKQPNFPNWFNKQKSKRFYRNELIIPNSIQQIGEGQFQNIKTFDWLIIGNGLKTIPKRAFQNISAEFIYLSESVEKIEGYAFADSNIRCIILANHSNVTISDTAFLKCNNIKLIFEHEWFSALVKYCDTNKLAHAGLGPMEEYFVEYAKIRLSEKETN